MPEPEFRQDGGMFVQTLRRDWLTAELFTSLGLGERQIKAMQVARQEHRVTNTGYQKLTGASRPTAKRDLEDLVRKGLLEPKGAGRGAHYELPRKRLMIGSNGSSSGKSGNGS